jgi:hypothetical protein
LPSVQALEIDLAGSSLFSVSGDAETRGGEMEHGDEFVHRAVTAGLAPHRQEDAVESSQEGVGRAPPPMGQNVFRWCSRPTSPHIAFDFARDAL